MRRSKKNYGKRIAVLLFLAFFLAAIAAASLLVWDMSRDAGGQKRNENLVVQIEVVSGDTTSSVAEKLCEAGVICYEKLFSVMASMEGLDTKLQVGVYEFVAGSKYTEIFDELKKPPLARPTVTITFPEGFEVSDIIERFLQNGIGTKEGFEAALDYAYDCEYIPPVGTPNRLEGFLYPDTYNFYKDDTEVNVFKKMINQFKAKAKSSGLAEKAAASGRTVYEALILGSIIQKESGKVSDFAMISSVFNNRLEIDMLLQSDAAVSYPIPKAERRPSCTAEQLKTDTPYNVYMHKGLTPTPICCPRIEAAVAACEPVESEYLYFIGTPAGETVFAKTYKEHQDNINKYLK